MNQPVLARQQAQQATNEQLTGHAHAQGAIVGAGARDPDFDRLLSMRPVDLGPRDFDEAVRQAEYLAASEMVPKSYRGKPGDCLIAIQWGGEIGLKPLQAMQSIAAVNGKPSLYGDAGKAMLLAHGCIIEEDDIEVVKANGRGRCVIKRRGRPPVQRTFSLEDAKTAKLWGKEGPWSLYPWRQMAWRAFWFAARDAAADILRGMGGVEEAIDGPGEWEASAAPPPPAAPASLPALDDKALDTDMPRFQAVVQSGKKGPPEIVAMLATKYTLTEQQKARILSLKKATTAAPPPPAPPAADAPPPASSEHDDFLSAMDAAGEGGAK